MHPARVTRYTQRHKPINSVQIFSTGQKKLISMMLSKWLSVWWSCGSLCKSGPNTVLSQPCESQVIPLRYKNKLQVKEHFLFLSLQNGWRPGCQSHGLSSVWENLPQVRKDKSWRFHPAGLAASILQVRPLTDFQPFHLQTQICELDKGATNESLAGWPGLAEGVPAQGSGVGIKMIFKVPPAQIVL